LKKGYGLADLENNVPNTPQTKFRLGSVTKQFTAMAIMQLQEQGRLKVDDPIADFIPDSPHWAKITIHNLLTHTSGIPNFTSFSDYRSTMMLPSPPLKTMERFKNKPLEFVPGESHAYSNSGYVVLGYIIEKASGKSYEQFLKENIFDPLHMSSSGYDHPGPLLEHRASGYSKIGEKFVNAAYVDMSIPHAAGALYSTVEDLFLWDRALRTEKLVRKSSLERMFTPFKKDYGYGWAITRIFNRRCVTHSGGINGFSSNISRFVDDDVCVIVLSNVDTSPASRIGRDLAAIAFGEKYELPAERTEIEINPKVFDDYSGKYQISSEVMITISRSPDRLFIELAGQPKFVLYPESETKFFLKVTDAQVTFVRDEKGEVSHLILHQGGEDTMAKKIE
jgi:CubicO group peptidase (beta-lactamase class C family)